MDVITIESKAIKELESKIDAIAEYILNKQETESINEDEIWVDSYEVYTFLKISSKNLQRLRGSSTIAYSQIRGRYFYKIGEIKRLLESRLIKSNEECMKDLITNHKLHVKERRIISRTNNGLNVFKHYITCQWRVGRNFLNPLYEGRKASCNIYFDRKTGVYKLKDFGNDEYSGDCLSFVGKLKGMNCNNVNDFVEILKTINRDLSLGLSEDMDNPVQSFPQTTLPIIIPEKKIKSYSFQERGFTRNELGYWQQYGITSELLLQYQVCSVREFQSENSEGKPYLLSSSPEEPIFGYKRKRFIKLYRPFSQL